MGFRHLDLDSYKRKNHFEYFNSLAFPYVGITVQVDITSFLAVVKERNLPFFLSFCYCAAKSANLVPEFRQRIRNGRIIEYDHCKTSHTVALEDGTYCFCTLDSGMEFMDYLPYAVQTQENAKNRIASNHDDSEELIFISSLPWISYTAMMNPVPVPADSHPRITWGKFTEQDSKVLIPVSVLCNHALVDGLHISHFFSYLECQIEEFAKVFQQ